MIDGPIAGQVDGRYDRSTIWLHWTTAALVALLWIIASPNLPMTGGTSVIDLFPRGAPRVQMRSIHILLGVSLALILFARLIWRAKFGRRLPAANTGWMGVAATLTHYALYVLLAVTLLLGLANVWVRGDSIFGLFSVPAFDPTNRALRQAVGGWHDAAANALVIVAGLHALAALFHHYVLRDNVLRRMLLRS